MPTQDYDLRLYGRRRCKNCFWYENGICFFNSGELLIYKIKETSWCPDWDSRRIESKEGKYLEDTPAYKEVNKVHNG